MTEDDRVCVMDFKLGQGAQEDFHAHPPHFIDLQTGFKIIFKFADGKTALSNTKTDGVRGFLAEMK